VIRIFIEGAQMIPPLRISLLVMATLGLSLGMTDPAQAVVVTFTGADPGATSANPRPNSDAAAAAFDAAAGAIGTVSVIDFESAPVGSFTNLSVATGVTMTSPVNQSIVGAPVPNEHLFGYNTTAGGSRFVQTHNFPTTVTFSFTPGVNSFGAYLSGLQGTGVGQQTITFHDGSAQVVNIPIISSGIAFVGFTDVGQSIASVTINLGTAQLGDVVGVDDLRFGRVAAVVPEVSSFAIASLLGVVGAAVKLWKRRT
jgi:hypothetical protein